MADLARLVDQSAYFSQTRSSPITQPCLSRGFFTSLGGVFEIDSLNGDFVLLLLLVVLNSDSFESIDSSDDVFSQELGEDKGLSCVLLFGVDGFVDHWVNWEMLIGELHLESVAFGDTGDHVLNVSSNRSHGTSLLLLTKPHSNNNSMVLYSVARLTR